MPISSATVQNCDIGSKGFMTNPQSFSSYSPPAVKWMKFRSTRPTHIYNSFLVAPLLTDIRYPHHAALPTATWCTTVSAGASSHCILSVGADISLAFQTGPPFTPCPRFLCASQVFLYNRKTQQEGSFFCIGAARAFFHMLTLKKADVQKKAPSVLVCK